MVMLYFFLRVFYESVTIQKTTESKTLGQPFFKEKESLLANADFGFFYDCNFSL